MPLVGLEPTVSPLSAEPTLPFVYQGIFVMVTPFIVSLSDSDGIADIRYLLTILKHTAGYAPCYIANTRDYQSWTDYNMLQYGVSSAGPAPHLQPSSRCPSIRRCDTRKGYGSSPQYIVPGSTAGAQGCYWASVAIMCLVHWTYPNRKWYRYNLH